MRRQLLARVSVCAAALALSSCGGGSGGGPSAPSGSNTTTITILSQNGAQSFSPNPASVGGRMVVFRNADAVVHRVRLNDGSLDTGDIAPGATSQAFQMPATGANYHCPLHSGMVGAVNPSAGGPPPECQGPYCDGNY